MISQRKPKRCCICTQVATRRCHDKDGATYIYLCSSCPSPSDIKSRARAIRDVWSVNRWEDQPQQPIPVVMITQKVVQTAYRDREGD